MRQNLPDSRQIKTPTIYLIEFYARHYSLDDFKDLLRRRNIPQEDQQELINQYNKIKEKIFAE